MGDSTNYCSVDLLPVVFRRSRPRSSQRWPGVFHDARNPVRATCTKKSGLVDWSGDRMLVGESSKNPADFPSVAGGLDRAREFASGSDEQFLTGG